MAAPNEFFRASGVVLRFLGLLTFLVHAGPAAFSQDGPAPKASVELVDVRLGIQGVYKLGQWTPLRIELSSGSGNLSDVDLMVRMVDPDGVPTEYRSAKFELPAGTMSVQRMLVKVGRRSSDLRVTVRVSEQPICTRLWQPSELPTAVAAGQQVVLSLGGELPLDAALAMRSGSRMERIAHQHIAMADELPRHWLGYAGIDALVLTTSKLEAFADYEPAQWAALRAWLELGGTLIWSAADQAEVLLRPTGPLHWLIPGRFDSVIAQRQTAGIEQFTAATRRLDQTPPGGSVFSIPMTLVGNPQGVVEAEEGFGNNRLPVIIRSTSGLGKTLFVAVDLDQDVFTHWVDLPRMLAKLLDLCLDEPADDAQRRSELGPITHVGYRDLVGQLRSALDQFPQVRLIPFSWIATLVAVYILLIGPLDYWLLKRWDRPEWTWATFPIAVVGFTTLAVACTWAWKGNALRVNQVSVVDMDLTSGIVRGTTWAHVYSPRTAKFRVATRPMADFDYETPPSQTTTWQGLPGDGLGGLERDEQSESFAHPYRVDVTLPEPDIADVQMLDFPIAIWSSRSFAGQWWGRVRWPASRPSLEAANQGGLAGTLTNPTPYDLDEAYLVFERWAYKLGSFPRNAVVQVDGSGGQDLQTLLTRRRVVKGRSVVTPWDRESTDVERIVSLMMYFAAAKGQAYTQLEHRFQRTLDWSDHLTAGHAVLWGRSRQSGSELLLDGQPIERPQDGTYCRLLIPVRAQGE